MRAVFLSIFCLSGAIGCDQQPYAQIPVDYCAHVDMKATPPTDLDMTAVPKCAAAKGLPGNNLVCVDFTSSQVMTDLTNAGWNFDKYDKSCWMVQNSKLQLNTANFTSYMGTCGFLIPALSANDYGKYNSFTLSVVHRLDISDTAMQTAQFMLGFDSPTTRLVTQWTGKQSRQQTILEMSKTDLPNGGTNMYQPLFKLSAPLAAGGTSQGWQIESIAINASQ